MSLFPFKKRKLSPEPSLSNTSANKNVFTLSNKDVKEYKQKISIDESQLKEKVDIDDHFVVIRDFIYDFYAFINLGIRNKKRDTEVSQPSYHIINDNKAFQYKVSFVFEKTILNIDDIVMISSKYNNKYKMYLSANKSDLIIIFIIEKDSLNNQYNNNNKNNNDDK
jgi:hypothetical protein